MPAQKLDKHSLKILNMEPTNIKSNNSHQQLMSDSDSVDVCAERQTNNSNSSFRDVSLRDWCTVSVLCFVNLINYMDRFTVAGILVDIQKYFEIGDDKAGLLQTVFVISYMLFAPLFGYLGDRYSRRYIMAFGVFLWCITTLLGSYATDFNIFLMFRCMVGIGEASYSTIAPTIISDLFVSTMRSKMLALFYFAIPVGSGLGYIVGAETSKLAGTWQWGLRVTPILGSIAFLLIIFLMKDPVRGEIEGTENLQPTSWKEDLQDLAKNRSFMLSTFGFTCVAFVAGALSWFGPKIMSLGIKLQPENNTSDDTVSYKFGIVAMISGLLGVPLGPFIAHLFREKYNNIDPIVCGIALLASSPFVFIALIAAEHYTNACFFTVFLGELFLNMTWSLVADVVLYVVIPTRRSTAEAFQILLSHALGDAGSPYLIGVISEFLKKVFSNNSYDVETIPFQSLQYALFITCFVEVLGGIFFILTSFYVLQDKQKVDQIVRGEVIQPRNIYADDPLTEVDQRRNLVS